LIQIEIGPIPLSEGVHMGQKRIKTKTETMSPEVIKGYEGLLVEIEADPKFIDNDETVGRGHPCRANLHAEGS